MINNNKVIGIIDEFVDIIVNDIKDLLCEESLEKVRCSDGRKVNAPECCKKGSFIYFLYDKHNEIIYIGETGQAIKNRLYTDGSGAHITKDWFKEVVKLKYYSNPQMDLNRRRLLERVCILKYNPKYNDKKPIK